MQTICEYQRYLDLFIEWRTDLTFSQSIPKGEKTCKPFANIKDIWICL